MSDLESVFPALAPALRPSARALVRRVHACGPTAVAFSGGVDSGLLAWVTHRVHGEAMAAVLGVSPSLADAERAAARAFARRWAIALVEVHPREIDDPRYRRNAPDRCFWCKDALFRAIATDARLRRFATIAYGANADDRFDHRPGALAAARHRVAAPLAESGLGKGAVRALARAAGLELWDKPAAPCLASRIPFGREVTPEALARVERAEDVLRAMGFTALRVRDHDETARVELPRADHARARARWAAIEAGIRASGFARVELEPDGLRSGRLSAPWRGAVGGVAGGDGSDGAAR